jgi:methylmalonyl-CoA/ethylmalonyl-CoA epimerase
MKDRIHHINFIVRDLDAAVPAWERVLGMPVTTRDQLQVRGVNIARFHLGHAWLALVQPVREGTVPARYLAEHGEGFFLLAIGVDDLAAEVERLGDGAFVGPARAGADDWQVRDLDPAQLFGAQLQLAADGQSD